MHRFVPSRMVIFARDIQNITGRSERTARLLLQRIRKTYGKKAGQYVSVTEFCQYTALPEDEVRAYLKH